VKASQTRFGISLGFADQAQSSMWRLSSGCTRSVMIVCRAHLWPITRSTIPGVQAWSGMPSRHSLTL
jgi:hypothetical protein